MSRSGVSKVEFEFGDVLRRPYLSPFKVIYLGRREAGMTGSFYGMVIKDESCPPGGIYLGIAPFWVKDESWPD